MELIDKVVRKMDFLIGLSAEDIYLLIQIIDNQMTIEKDDSNVEQVKAYDFFVNKFCPFLDKLKEEAEANGIRPDGS